jgi:hypothetical protein
MTSAKNKRQLGAAQARGAMLAIASVGWLTTAQVGAWIWPDLERFSARKRALKLLTRLVHKGHLVTRVTPLGEHAYVLTNPGARQCVEWYGEEGIRDGLELSQLDVGRQARAVQWLMDKKRAGLSVVGAAGIRYGHVRGHVDEKAVRGADGLAFDSETVQWTAALVVRNEHDMLVRKAIRIRQGVDSLELLGEVKVVGRFIAKFNKEWGAAGPAKVGPSQPGT